MSELKEVNQCKENDEPVRVAPFSKMTVTAEVDWDAEENEVKPNSIVVQTYTAEELKNAEVVDVGEIDDTGWYLYEQRLEDFVSEQLSDEYGFCHNGFSLEYTFKRKTNLERYEKSVSNAVEAYRNEMAALYNVGLEGCPFEDWLDWDVGEAERAIRESREGKR